MFKIQNVNYANGTTSTGLFTLLQYKIMNAVTGLVSPATGLLNPAKELYLGYYHKTYYKGAHYAAIYPNSTASQNTNTWFFQADGSVNYKIINTNPELKGWNHLTFHKKEIAGHTRAAVYEESGSNLLWQIEEGESGYNIKNPTKGVDGYLNFVNTAYYNGNHHFAEVRNIKLGGDWKVQLDMSSVYLEYNVTNVEFDKMESRFFVKKEISSTIVENSSDKTMTCRIECSGRGISYYDYNVAPDPIPPYNFISFDIKPKAVANINISKLFVSLVVDGKLMGKLNFDKEAPSEGTDFIQNKFTTITVPPKSCVQNVWYATWFIYFYDKYGYDVDEMSRDLFERVYYNFDTSIKDSRLPFTATAEVSAYADVLNQETGEVQKHVKIDNPEAIKHIILESYKEGNAPKILAGKDTVNIQLNGKAAFLQLVDIEAQTDDVDCTTLSDADLHYSSQVTNQNCEYTDLQDEHTDPQDEHIDPQDEL